MSVLPQSLTADELLDMPNLGRCELVRGELIMMSPAGFPHGEIAIRIGRYLDAFVDEHGLGSVAAAETGFILARDPDTVRAPDVAFVRGNRLPHESEAGFFDGAPDLAVEVLSPGDRSGDVRAKTEEWLEAGCLVVWIVDPKNRTITVHRSGWPEEFLSMTETLTADEILPGFQLPVAKVFNRR